MVDWEQRQENLKMSPEYLFVLEKKYSKHDGDMLKEYIRWLEEILCEYQNNVSSGL